MEDFMLTFGKYAGKHLREIPDRSYLEWLSTQDIRKQPKAAQATRDYLAAHPVSHSTAPRKAREPGPAPRTLQEAEKLGWMAEKHYGNAKETLLAARDPDGFLVVYDEEDDDLFAHLLVVFDSGSVAEASAYSCTRQQIEHAIARYGDQICGGSLLADVDEQEKLEEEEKRRSLVLRSLNGTHTITLSVWDAQHIDVSIDGRDQGAYRFRELSEQERTDPYWQSAAAILEPDEDDPLGRPGSRFIGLTPERRTLVEQKIQEVSHG